VLELMGQRDSFFRGLLEAVRAGEHLEPGNRPPAADGDPAKPWAARTARELRAVLMRKPGASRGASL